MDLVWLWQGACKGIASSVFAVDIWVLTTLYTDRREGLSSSSHAYVYPVLGIFVHFLSLLVVVSVISLAQGLDADARNYLSHHWFTPLSPQVLHENWLPTTKLSRHRRPYTRFGVYRLVERCAARVPSLAQRKITPHVLRHTTACQLVQAGIDLETKAKAMELCEEGDPGPTQPWKQDKGLIAFLNAL